VTAYIKSGTKPVVGIINDNVDQGLVVFMRQIVTEYGEWETGDKRAGLMDSLAAEIDYADTKCGYGCSDFVSLFIILC
jgi:leucyl aminopeptidase